MVLFAMCFEMWRPMTKQNFIQIAQFNFKDCISLKWNHQLISSNLKFIDFSISNFHFFKLFFTIIPDQMLNVIIDSCFQIKFTRSNFKCDNGFVLESQSGDCNSGFVPDSKSLFNLIFVALTKNILICNVILLVRAWIAIERLRYNTKK